MGFFNNLIITLLAFLTIISLVFTIKNHPHLFSKENLNKSSFTMGVLALILIAAISIVVLILRN